MKKIKASTLTEVLVALVIISVVTALFFTILIKAGNYHRHRLYILAHQKMVSCIDEVRESGYLDEEYLESEGFYIHKTCHSYKNIPGVYVVETEAYTRQQKKIDSHKAIITIHVKQE